MRRVAVITAAFCLVALAGGLTENALAAEMQADAKIHVINGPMPAVKAPDKNFTGDVSVARLFPPQDPLHLSGGYVTFSPGSRTNWHSHPEGQMLIVTSGKGRVQQWGDPVIEIREGDVVWFPATVKHWHGAMPDQGMTHISIAEIVEGKSSDWMEKVTDDQYSGK